MRIIVFAPHPDDETLGCGGTIARKISQGFEVIIVLVTDGRHAYSKVLNVKSNPTPEELIEIRKDEFRRATSLLGVPNRNLVFLGFEDGTLEEHEAEAEAKISKIMRENLPGEVYFTFGRDCNPDHRALNRIIKRQADDLGAGFTMFQYSIMHTYARVGPIVERLIAILNRSLVEVDVSEFLDVKKRAILQFESEILPEASRKKDRPVHKDASCFLKRHETYYLYKQNRPKSFA